MHLGYCCTCVITGEWCPATCRNNALGSQCCVKITVSGTIRQKCDHFWKLTRSSETLKTLCHCSITGQQSVNKRRAHVPLPNKDKSVHLSCFNTVHFLKPRVLRAVIEVKMHAVKYRLGECANQVIITALQSQRDAPLLSHNSWLGDRCTALTLMAPLTKVFPWPPSVTTCGPGTESWSVNNGNYWRGSTFIHFSHTSTLFCKVRKVTRLSSKYNTIVVLVSGQ